MYLSVCVYGGKGVLYKFSVVCGLFFHTLVFTTACPGTIAWQYRMLGKCSETHPYPLLWRFLFLHK